MNGDFGARTHLSSKEILQNGHLNGQSSVAGAEEKKWHAKHCNGSGNSRPGHTNLGVALESIVTSVTEAKWGWRNVSIDVTKALGVKSPD